MTEYQNLALLVSVIGCAMLVLDRVVGIAKGQGKSEQVLGATETLPTQLAVLQTEVTGLRRDLAAWMEQHNSLGRDLQEIRDRVTKLEASKRA